MGLVRTTSGLLVLIAACTVATPEGASAAIPDGAAGIGFDDLRYSAALHRVLAPAGRTGTLALVDPDTLAVTTVAGFRGSPGYTAGTHDDGRTSVDEAPGVLFVADRSAGTLSTVDPAEGRVMASTATSSTPGYVRYVATTREVWVTEPASHQIEIFTLSGVTATSAGVIPVTDGGVSLAIDAGSGRAYTHRKGSTVAIDVTTRAIVADWPNGCDTSRGLALDTARGFLFAGCDDGTLAVLDAAHDGHVLGSLAKGSGGDVLGYSPALGHAYQAGSDCACLVIFGVPATGVPVALGQVDAPATARCATADDLGHAWVCDPANGQLFRVIDTYPSSL